LGDKEKLAKNIKKNTVPSVVQTLHAWWVTFGTVQTACSETSGHKVSHFWTPSLEQLF